MKKTKEYKMLLCTSFLSLIIFPSYAQIQMQRIDGILVIEKSKFSEIVHGDVTISDHKKFNCFYFESLDSVFHVISEQAILHKQSSIFEQSSSCFTELVPAVELRGQPFGNTILKQDSVLWHKSSSWSAEVFTSLVDSTVNSFPQADNKGLYYLIYEIDWEVIDGKALYDQLGECYYKPERNQVRKNCPLYYLEAPIKKLDQIGMLFISR